MIRRNKILIVDDIELNRIILAQLFGNEYEILEAENGQEALKLLEQYSKSIVIVLLDLLMPVLDGFETLNHLQNTKILHHIPVILITGDTSNQAEQKGYELGASDIITKPFDSKIVKRRVSNIIELYEHKNNLELLVEQQTRKIQRQSRKLEETNNQIIETLSTVVEFRNLESGMHIRRIKGFTRVLARYMAKHYPEYGLTEEKIKVIVQVSAMHDVGKIAIPDSILLKPGKLTKEERQIMETHTTKGCEIINTISVLQNKEYFGYTYEICRYHHERYDGGGYPDGLRGDEIPIAAQIVSVADVYDALVSDRVYKSAYSKAEAFEMICEGKCGIFSPKLLDCFRNTRKKLEEFADRNTQLQCQGNV